MQKLTQFCIGVIGVVGRHTIADTSNSGVLCVVGIGMGTVRDQPIAGIEDVERNGIIFGMNYRDITVCIIIKVKLVVLNQSIIGIIYRLTVIIGKQITGRIEAETFIGNNAGVEIRYSAVAYATEIIISITHLDIFCNIFFDFDPAHGAVSEFKSGDDLTLCSAFYRRNYTLMIVVDRKSGDGSMIDK
ncbi:MAG: hypothetical protein IJ043_03680 [Clostridia bacterium]|nr:hypothetical protein [Clostridia bacterium]